MSNNIKVNKSFHSHIVVQIEQLRKIVIDLLLVNKLPKDQAKIVADCFVEAEACGVTSHGASVLPAHIKKLRTGGYNIMPSFSILREGGAFAVIDADNAMGIVSATYSMRYAIKNAKIQEYLLYLHVIVIHMVLHFIIHY